MLKAHHQNDTTVVCFKQLCRFPDSPTPASHYRHRDQAETCRGGCRKWKWLQPLSCIWQKQIKSTEVCAVIAGRRPKTGHRRGNSTDTLPYYKNVMQTSRSDTGKCSNTCMSWIDVAFLLNNLTESPLIQIQTTTVTNYSSIIILVTLMKEKSDIYGALHKAHTIKLADEWDPKLCHYGHTKIVKASQIQDWQRSLRPHTAWTLFGTGWFNRSSNTECPFQNCNLF